MGKTNKIQQVRHRQARYIQPRLNFSRKISYDWPCQNTIDFGFISCCVLRALNESTCAYGIFFVHVGTQTYSLSFVDCCNNCCNKKWKSFFSCFVAVCQYVIHVLEPDSFDFWYVQYLQMLLVLVPESSCVMCTTKHQMPFTL